ncbi:MAG: hypothetical protein Q6L60_01045 [Thermostichus sp. HHBFW_bins_43]
MSELCEQGSHSSGRGQEEETLEWIVDVYVSLKARRIGIPK